MTFLSELYSMKSKDFLYKSTFKAIKFFPFAIIDYILIHVIKRFPGLALLLLFILKDNPSFNEIRA